MDGLWASWEMRPHINEDDDPYILLLVAGDIKVFVDTNQCSQLVNKKQTFIQDTRPAIKNPISYLRHSCE